MKKRSLYLDLGVKPELVSGFKAPELTGKYTIHAVEFEDILEPNFLDRLSKVLDLSYVKIFELPPLSQGIIHIDGNYTNKVPRGALNFTLNSYVDWEMQWYSYSGDYVVVDSPHGPKGKGQHTRLLDTSVATCIGTHSFTDLCLVRSDVPHTALNKGTQTRWCVTLRTKDTSFEYLLDATKELASSSCLAQTDHERLL